MTFDLLEALRRVPIRDLTPEQLRAMIAAANEPEDVKLLRNILTLKTLGAFGEVRA